MSIADKEKWDVKYVEKSQLLKPRQASERLKIALKHLEGKRVLELASGAGRNAIFLAKNALFVDALDIAKIALESLEKNAKSEDVEKFITTKEQDLDDYTPEKNLYDLVVITSFLDRELIKRVQKSLKKGALFFIETYMKDPSNNKEFANQDNMLDAGELKKLFSEGFEIIYYDEFENEPYEMYRMKKQVIIAKKVEV